MQGKLNVSNQEVNPAIVGTVKCFKLGNKPANMEQIFQIKKKPLQIQEQLDISN